MDKSIYPYFQEKKWITKNKDSKNKKMYRDLEVQMSKVLYVQFCTGDLILRTMVCVFF